MAVENFVCVQCGTQFDESAQSPSACPICEDERQFVRHEGQAWTTLKRMAPRHRNRLKDEASHLVGIGTEPDLPLASALYFYGRRKEICFGIASRSSTKQP